MVAGGLCPRLCLVLCHRSPLSLVPSPLARSQDLFPRPRLQGTAISVPAGHGSAPSCLPGWWRIGVWVPSVARPVSFSEGHFPPPPTHAIPLFSLPRPPKAMPGLPASED